MASAIIMLTSRVPPIRLEGSSEEGTGAHF
jgi:hypothetical protein